MGPTNDRCDRILDLLMAAMEFLRRHEFQIAEKLGEHLYALGDERDPRGRSILLKALQFKSDLARARGQLAEAFALHQHALSLLEPCDSAYYIEKAAMVNLCFEQGEDRHGYELLGASMLSSLAARMHPAIIHDHLLLARNGTLSESVGVPGFMTAVARFGEGFPVTGGPALESIWMNDPKAALDLVARSREAIRTEGTGQRDITD